MTTKRNNVILVDPNICGRNERPVKTYLNHSNKNLDRTHVVEIGEGKEGEKQRTREEDSRSRFVRHARCVDAPCTFGEERGGAPALATASPIPCIISALMITN